jgi:hypothetical protein
MESSTQEKSSTVYETVKQTIIYNISKKLLNTLHINTYLSLNKGTLQTLLSPSSNYNNINKIYGCMEKLKDNYPDFNSKYKDLIEFIETTINILNTFDYNEIIFFENLLQI